MKYEPTTNRSQVWYAWYILSVALVAGCVESTSDRTVIPTAVEDALNRAISDTVLSNEDAVIINDWLNSSVRLEKRDLRIVVRPERGRPTALVEKVRDGHSLSVEERGNIVEWIVDGTDVSWEELPHQLLDAARGKQLTPQDRSILGKWLAMGPSQRNLQPPHWPIEPGLWPTDDYMAALQRPDAPFASGGPAAPEAPTAPEASAAPAARGERNGAEPPVPPAP